MPSYDYSGEDNNKAPRLQGLAHGLAIPDLDVSKDGRRFWVEVKTKTRSNEYRKQGILKHGIHVSHFEQYLEVERITGTAVWLVIYEESTGALLSQRLSELAKVADFDRRPVMARGGMVYFPRDSFINLGVV